MWAHPHMSTDGAIPTPRLHAGKSTHALPKIDRFCESVLFTSEVPWCFFRSVCAVGPIRVGVQNDLLDLTPLQLRNVRNHLIPITIHHQPQVTIFRAYINYFLLASLILFYFCLHLRHFDHDQKVLKLLFFYLKMHISCNIVLFKTAGLRGESIDEREQRVVREALSVLKTPQACHKFSKFNGFCVNSFHTTLLEVTNNVTPQSLMNAKTIVMMLSSIAASSHFMPTNDNLLQSAASKTPKRELR